MSFVYSKRMHEPFQVMFAILNENSLQDNFSNSTQTNSTESSLLTKVLGVPDNTNSTIIMDDNQQVDDAKMSNSAQTM